MNDERNDDGTFKPGHPGTSPGRPRRATEAARLSTLNDVVSEERWREICEKAYQDATGYDYQAREKGRRFIADYSIGRPRQTIQINTDGDDWADEFAQYTDDQLRAIERGEIIEAPAAGPGPGPTRPGGGRVDAGAPASRARSGRPGSGRKTKKTR